MKQAPAASNAARKLPQQLVAVMCRCSSPRPPLKERGPRNQVGTVRDPGRYMFRFGWVSITAEDLAIWNRFPDATFALYEVPSAEGHDEYRLGSVDLPTPDPDAAP